MRTGPFTFRFFSLAPRIKSAQTVDGKPKFTHTHTRVRCHPILRKLWLRIAYTVTRVGLLKVCPHSSGVDVTSTLLI